MAFGVNPAQTVILDLDTHNTNRYLLEPSLQSDNILSSGIDAYRLISGVKDKIRLTYLNKPKNMLVAATDCETWEPKGKFKHRSNELQVCDFELMCEQCADEFDEGCLRNLQASGNKVLDIDASPTISAMQRAMVEQIKRGLVDDLYKIAWFGDRDAGVAGYQYEDIAGTHLASPEGEDLLEMLNVCDGFWKEIYDKAEAGIIKSVDTYDGTEDGDATHPANIEPFLDDLIQGSDMLLQQWQRRAPITERPIILLQTGLFRALVANYKAKSCLKDCSLIYNGLPVPGATTYCGYPVFEVCEWDMFDMEIGAWNAEKNISLKQRALFMAQRNLVIGHDIVGLDRQGRPGLVVQKSPLLREKGKYYWWLRLRFGMGIEQDQLITAGYNSVLTDQ